MDRFKLQVDQLQQQLAGLTLSQKMLTATLVAIMVATVVWWGHYAATDEMVPLFDSGIPAEQLGGVQSALAGRSIPHVVEGDRVLVPLGRRDAAITLLAWDKRLPTDLASPLGDAIAKIGAFDTRQKIDLITKQAAEQALAKLLGDLPGVRHVQVALNTEYRRQIGGDLLPGAAVTITSTGGEDANRIAATASRLVAFSIPAMKPERVVVAVDGRTIDSIDPADPLAGGAHLKARREAEVEFAEAVRKLLPNIPNLTIGVSVEVSNTVTRTSVRKPDPESKITVPVREQTETRDAQAASPVAVEPGAIPNMPASLSQGAGPSDTDTRERTETESLADWGRTQEETFQDRGTPRPVACSLSIPLDWLVAQWKGRNRTEEDPSPEVLATYETSRLAELRKVVANALGLADEKIYVLVDTGADSGFARAGIGSDGGSGGAAGAGGTESASGISGLIRDYGKEVAVAALAAVSLFLVSTMVKKGAALAPMASPTFDGQSVALYGGDELAGIAGEAEGLMTAQEIGDDAVQAGQMLDQVQTLVKENPDAAAALVRRWLNVG